MHGLIGRAIQLFVSDMYGAEAWAASVAAIGMDDLDFEAMLTYPDMRPDRVVAAVAEVLGRDEAEVLEDIGTYLVSHPTVEALRRLLRFGGVSFVEFLHSLDDLPDRARLAVEDLELPRLELQEDGPSSFRLSVEGVRPGFDHVMAGLLRTIADDYGALVLIEHEGRDGAHSMLRITVLETAFSEGRSFELGARAG